MTSTDVAAVEAANQEFYEAFETLDMERMSAIWADREDVSCVHPGLPLRRGRSEVLRSWALIMANTPFIQFVLTDVAVMISGDIAIVICTENVLTAGDANDDEDTTLAAGGRIVSSNTFLRTPYGWRLWMYHGSPVLNREEVDDDDL